MVAKKIAHFVLLWFSLPPVQNARLCVCVCVRLWRHVDSNGFAARRAYCGTIDQSPYETQENQQRGTW